MLVTEVGEAGGKPLERRRLVLEIVEVLSFGGDCSSLSHRFGLLLGELGRGEGGDDGLVVELDLAGEHGRLGEEDLSNLAASCESWRELRRLLESEHLEEDAGRLAGPRAADDEAGRGVVDNLALSRRHVEEVLSFVVLREDGADDSLGEGNKLGEGDEIV